jgi:hypothetical protein
LGPSLRWTTASQETQLVADSIFWEDLTFLYELGLWQHWAMTYPETLHTKNVINELSFLLVTHMTCLETRFDRYEFLKLGFSVGQILDRLVI